jgi:hypothetical protein
MKKQTNKRKDFPLYTGLLKFFPDALMEVSRTSKVSNDTHVGGDVMVWSRDKSSDHLDALMRHLKDYACGEDLDSDGCYHLSKVIWRACAQLQMDLEK